MKFVVIGASDFTINIAKSIIDSGHELSMVVSPMPQLLPDNSADIHSFCVSNKVPHLEVDDINSESSIDKLKNKKPDFIFSSWPKILRKQFLDIPKNIVIGTHPTLLPMNQGGIQYIG